MLILRGLRDAYEEHHEVRYTDDALARRRRAVRPLRHRPVPARQGHRPDRPGRRAGAAALRRPGRRHGARLEQRLAAAASARRTRPSAPSTTRSASRCATRSTRCSRARRRRGRAGRSRIGTPRSTATDIAEVISRATGIPVTRLTEDERERLLQLEDRAARAGHRPGRRGRRGRRGRAAQPRGHGRPATGRSAASCSSARPASARPSWRRRSRSRCSATRTA